MRWARVARSLVVAAATSVAAATLLSAVLGFGSSLPQSSRTLGANAASVPRCDTDGVTVVQNLSGSNVVSVTVSGIAGACGGGSLSLDVNNGMANSSGSGTVPGGGGTMTVTLSSAVAARDAEQTDISISGP